MRRRDFIAGLGSTATAWPLKASSQPSKVRFILWVSTEAQPDPFIAAFREAMRERGYLEGQNLAFVLRYAPGDPAALRAMLPTILDTTADLIVSSGPAILAMRAATDRPVLFAISGDPVALGIAQSFPRPGGNFTGTTFLSLDVAQKRVQLVPGLSGLATGAKITARIVVSRQPVDGAKLLLCLSQPLGQVARAGVGPASFGRSLAAGRQQSNPKGGLQIEFAPVALGSLRKSPQGVQAGRELRDGLLHS